MRTRTLVVGGVLTALLIAGVGSFFASNHPDGLMHVAQRSGFADSARDSAAKDSPLSGYRVKGVENGAVSGGLAGVVGALVVLVLAGGLTYVVRRRGPAGSEGRDSADTAEDGRAQDGTAQDGTAQDGTAQDGRAEPGRRREAD